MSSALIVALASQSLVLRTPPSRLGQHASPRMQFDWELLPGFWKSKCPDGYARASHCLFLGTGDDEKQKAQVVLERIQKGLMSFTDAARQYSYCPTRDQDPAGDLGTFASLSSMSAVDELRSFEGKLELPYEGQNTRAFDEAIFAAPIGEPQLVQSSWGFHLILVTERGSGPPAIRSPESAVAFDGSVAEPKDDAGKSL